MSTVSLTVSKTLNGANISDSLTGGATGYDFQVTESGDANPPQKPFYLRHDGASLINNLSVYARPFSATYGGDYSANADYTKLQNHGDAGFGLQMDFDWDTVTPFQVGLYTTFNSTTGLSFSTRITIPTVAMLQYNGGSPIAATSPVAGELGPAGTATLGDTIKHLTRYMLPASETQSGKRQFDIVYAYNFTT